ENKNIKEPEEKKEEKRENRKEEENKKMPKVKLNKTEGDIYLTKIKQNINLKNDALNKVTLLRENLDAARSQVSTMVKELRTNFFNLLAVSDKIEHILLSIGIPLSIQKYELEELENEINNKFTLEDIGLEIVKDEIKNKEGHKKVKFTLLKSNPNEKIIESLEKIKNFLKNTNTYKVIDVYKDLVIVNSFFKNERDSVNENVKRIIKLDLQKENKYKTKTCETFIKKICNFSELIDEVS
ncbi:hypothetical protein TUBRATIS_20600, partial [Tubulinosema ratisbonensis]